MKAEITRRTKLLYGHSNIKKLIENSSESRQIMNLKNKSSKDVQVNDRKKKKKCREYLDPDNFIISSKSRLKTIFDMICLLVVTYSIFYSLLFVSFDP